MKIKKQDKEYLIQMIKKDHKIDSGTLIKNCPHEDCWHKKMIKIIEEL